MLQVKTLERVLTYRTPRTLEGFLLTLSSLCWQVWVRIFMSLQRIVMKRRKFTKFDNDKLIYVGVYCGVVCLIKVQDNGSIFLTLPLV